LVLKDREEFEDPAGKIRARTARIRVDYETRTSRAVRDWIYASLISRPRASCPIAANAASASATTTTVMASTAR